MRLFTRLSASLAATTSEAVARFENHEAVGAVAIEHCRCSVAAARAAVRRHDQAGAALLARRADAVRDNQTWSRRASASSDDAVARDCLARRREARERLSTLESDQHRHDATRTRLADRAAELDRTLAQLVARHAELASREALVRTDNPGCGAAADSTSVFERWETSVETEELRRVGATDGTDIDDLDARFDAEERRAALDAELAELRASEQAT